MQGKYTIKGMHFHAFHGTLEVERELGLVFSVDVSLLFELHAADVSEDAAALIKGADVYDLTKGLMMGTKYKSRTNLAVRIARELLAKYGHVQEAHVVVSKRHVFIAGDVDFIMAEVFCKREDFAEL